MCMSDTNICENITSRDLGANCNSFLDCKSLTCIGGICFQAPSWTNQTCNTTSTNITQCHTNTECTCFYSGLTSCYPATQNLPCGQEAINYVNCLYDNGCFFNIGGGNGYFQAPIDNNTCSYQKCYNDTLLYYSCLQPTLNLFYSDLCFFNPWKSLIGAQ